MNQSSSSQEQQTLQKNPLLLYHERANQAYNTGDYRQALKELQQALSYASSEKDLDVIEQNMRIISDMIQKEEAQAMQNPPEPTAETQESLEPPFYQNRLLLITILVGLICLTPIIMKFIEIFTHKPAVQEQVTSPAVSIAPTQETTETTEPVTTTAVPVASEALVTGSGVALREQPGTTATVLSRLSQNERVQVLEDKSQTVGGYIWSKVQTSTGQVGWVSASLTTAAPEQATSPVQNSTAATAETAVTEQTETSAVANSEAPPTTSGNLKKVIASGVSLRSGPSVNQALITTLPADTELEVLQNSAVTADGLTWSQVKTSQGTIGWIASKYIQP